MLVAGDKVNRSCRLSARAVGDAVIHPSLLHCVRLYGFRHSAAGDVEAVLDPACQSQNGICRQVEELPIILRAGGMLTNEIPSMVASLAACLQCCWIVIAFL